MFDLIKKRPYLLGNDCDNKLCILTESDLSKYHTDIGVELNHATTFYSYMSNSEWYRIDSKIIDEKMRDSCRIFRSYCGNNPCYKKDEKHVKCLSELTIDHLKNGTPLLDDMEIMYSNNRYYIRYVCSYLNHFEFIFPVIIKGYIVAVLFLGQYNAPGYDTYTALDNYLKEIPSFFLDNCTENTEKLKLLHKNKLTYINKSIINEIKKAEKVSRRKNNSVTDVPLNKICKLLSDLEDNLNLHYIRQAVIEVQRSFEKIKKKVFNELADIYSLQYDDRLSAFWKIILKYVKDMLFELEHMSIYIYGNKQYNDSLQYSTVTKLPKLFELVADGDTSPSIFPNGVLIDDSIFTREYPSILTNEEIYDFFSIQNNSNTTVVFIWPAFNDSCSIVFEFHLTEYFNIRYSSEIIDEIFNNLLNLFAYIFSGYQSIWSSISKEKVMEQKQKNEDSFSIFSHEISQHTAALSRIYLYNLSRKEYIQKIHNDIFEKISEDFYSSVEMLDYLAKNSNIYIGKIEITPSLFWAFGDKIFKFTNIFKAEAKEKSIGINTPDNLNPSDKYRSELYTDIVLFEQMLFNIMRNAFQYSHPCTNILIDCKKDNLNIDTPHKLIVKNVGIELDDKVDIFGFQERGKEAIANYESGTGIGLFVVDKIVKALGGKIETRKEVISERFNLPLAKQYIRIVEKGKQDEKKIYNDLQKLVDTHSFFKGKYFNKDIMKVYGDSFICDRIEQATWKTVFEIEIPYYKENLL